MSEEFIAPETGAEQPAAPALVEAPVSEAQVAPEAEAPEAPPQENKAKERLSLRFSELTSQRETARQEAAREREEKEYWRQQALSRQEEAPQYDDGYVDHDIDGRVERALEARLQRQTEQETQNAFNKSVLDLRTTLLESGLDGAALIATGANDVPFTRAMFDALSVSEQPAAIADHLGRNPGEASRIAALPPVQQGVELARLEIRLASQSPRTTNALPPPTLVGARGVASSDPNGMTMEQYIAARTSGKI